MTKYDILHDRIIRMQKAGEITEAVAIDLDAKAYEQYNDVEVTEAEVAEYLDNEMGKNHAEDGYPTDTDIPAGSTSINPSDKGTSRGINDATDYLDNEMGAPAALDGFNAGVSAYQGIASTALDPSTKGNSPSINDGTDYLDNEMGVPCSCETEADKRKAVQENVKSAFIDGVITVEKAIGLLNIIE